MSEASEEETVVGATPSDSAESEFSPFDETSEAFSPSLIRKVIGPDGLPTQSAPPSGANDIRPLSPETLVCMGDGRKYVIRDGFGKIEEEFEPKEVTQSKDGKFWVLTTDIRWMGLLRVDVMKEVEQFRPACKHYVRQITQFDKNPEYRDHLRLCSARRTTEGTFMTLKDSAMWACSMREPRHLESEKLISKFDLLKEEQGRRREHFSLKGNEKK